MGLSHSFRLGLRPLSALLVGVHGLAGLAGLGPATALVHAGWFSMLLTRNGRMLAIVASTILGVWWIVACATPGRSGVCLAGAVLILSLAIVWLAIRGMDELEAFWHGRTTEDIVRRRLERLARRLTPRGAVRNGVLLRSGDHFTEIDHVLITASGILVVESKGYTGTVDVDPASGTWSRTTMQGDVEYIDDPVHQNQGHLHAISRVFPDAPATSLVVMPRATLGPDVPLGVVGLDGLAKLHDWAGFQGGNLDVAQLARMLDEADQSSEANRRAHLAWAQRIRGGRENPAWHMRRIRAATVLYFGVPMLVSMVLLVSQLWAALQ